MTKDTIKRDKKNNLNYIKHGALIYNEKLCGKKIMFVCLCKTNNELYPIEVDFRDTYFLHLTETIIYSKLLQSELYDNLIYQTKNFDWDNFTMPVSIQCNINSENMKTES